jgi:hypothetical protein
MNSVERFRREVDHLLADDAHLLSIRPIAGQKLDLLGDGRARATPRGGLAESDANNPGLSHGVDQ